MALTHLYSCFPHVVNLACKAILAAITNMKFAEQGAEDFVPTKSMPTDFRGAIKRDPIATVRTLVRVVSLSGL